MPRTITLDEYQALPDGTKRQFDRWLEAEGLSQENVRGLTIDGSTVLATSAATNENGNFFYDQDQDPPVVATVEKTFTVGSQPPAF